MLPHCDFQEQASTRDADGSLLRPDLVVRIPGGKHVVVDAKAPLAAYLDACECEDDDDARPMHLVDHARQVRDHMNKLAQKAYWRQFEPSPDFVIMFVPDETFIRVAQEHDAALSEDGWRQGVILASPSTLFTLLRTVAATWQQETVAESAREVHELGRELYGRIATMARHLADAGKGLDNAVKHYNAAVRSLETRVLVQAAPLRAARHRGRASTRRRRSSDRHCRCRRRSSSSRASSSARSTPPSTEGLEPEDRADPVDGIEILAVLDCEDVAAVRERQADREVEPVVARLHRRPVERARDRVRARRARTTGIGTRPS